MTFLEYSLQNDSKPLSPDNKVLSDSIRLFSKCDCGRKTELTESMKSDHIKSKYGSECGWSYKCRCNKRVSVWEGAFDSAIESLSENGLILWADDEYDDFY